MLEQLRPLAKSINEFQFGEQTIRTKVNLLVPADDSIESLNITAELAASAEDDMMMAGLHEEEQPWL